MIENGLDSALFKPEHKRENPFRFLFVGRLHAIKNIQLLIVCFNELLIDFPDIELHIYGEGPEKANLMALAMHYGLATSVLFFDWVKKEKLPEVYNAAHCFINPSLNEGLPNTVMEAMACALPVIASNVVGNNNLIAHKENGLLFESDNLSDFKAQCLWVMNNFENATNLGLHARKLIVDNYSVEAMAQKYLTLLAL
jgi:glycosyltransferase involved in cell wall biosynthesis